MASLVLTGDTSGQVTLAAPAVAGTTTLTLPATTGTVLNDATVGVCRAWVNFNGATAGTNTPRAAFNVSSVTKNSAADYTINFTNALANANYIMVGSIASNSTFSSTIPIVKSATQLGSPSNKTTTVCQIITPNYASTLTDNVTEIYCAFIGG